MTRVQVQRKAESLSKDFVCGNETSKRPKMGEIQDILMDVGLQEGGNGISRKEAEGAV